MAIQLVPIRLRHSVSETDLKKALLVSQLSHIEFQTPTHLPKTKIKKDARIFLRCPKSWVLNSYASANEMYPIKWI